MSTQAISVETQKVALGKLRSTALRQLEQHPPEEIAAALERQKERNKWASYYPDEGPLRRELYYRHLEFFKAGEKHCERAFIAANRIGKNDAACYELNCHLTGIYPKWWEGFRFRRPTKWWVAHRTWADARDTNQAQLLGTPGEDDSLGTGMIPAHLIHKTIPNAHIKFAMESFQVKHVSGGISTVQFKAYEQGWEAFTSAKVDGAWLDELCPLDVYSELKMRTADTAGGKKNGMIILTFTPLQGLTDLVKTLKEQAVNSDKLGW